MQGTLPRALKEDVVRPCLEHLLVSLYSTFPRQLLDYLSTVDMRVREKLAPFFGHLRLHPLLIGAPMCCDERC